MINGTSVCDPKCGRRETKTRKKEKKTGGRTKTKTPDRWSCQPNRIKNQNISPKLIWEICIFGVTGRDGCISRWQRVIHKQGLHNLKSFFAAIGRSFGKRAIFSPMRPFEMSAQNLNQATIAEARGCSFPNISQTIICYFRSRTLIQSATAPHPMCIIIISMRFFALMLLLRMLYNSGVRPTPRERESSRLEGVCWCTEHRDRRTNTTHCRRAERCDWEDIG